MFELYSTPYCMILSDILELQIIFRCEIQLRVLSNMDPRIEPFIYPLFYPSGMLGWHERMTYISKQGETRRITRLMFTKYRLAFRNYVEKKK